MIKGFLRGLVLIWIANSAFAADVATYNIKSKIYLDNQLISSPHMIAHENQNISFNLVDKKTNQRLDISLVAKNESDKKRNSPINLAYDITFSDGKTSSHEKPSVIVNSHQKGSIKLKTASGHTLEMSMVAVRT